MSRDLVTFNRTERDRQNKDAVERLCTDMGCSEPVARNFLKYKRFGIGPLADFGAARQRAQRPRSAEGADEEASDPLQKFRRVQDLEKRLQEQKEKEEREEQEFLEEMKKKRQSKRAGLKPLGPVMAREEAVDPLQKVATSEALGEPEEPQAPAEDTNQTGQWLSVPRPVDWKKEEEEKKRKLQEQQHHKHKKKKKRRRDDDEKSEESEQAARKRVRSRSRSVPEEEEPRKGSSSSAGLMTEKEVLAMMGKEKAKEKPQRGSVQARLRIQREMQEWNSTKAENEEFWKEFTSPKSPFLQIFTQMEVLHKELLAAYQEEVGEHSGLSVLPELIPKHFKLPQGSVDKGDDEHQVEEKQEKQEKLPEKLSKTKSKTGSHTSLHLPGEVDMPHMVPAASGRSSLESNMSASQNPSKMSNKLMKKAREATVNMDCQIEADSLDSALQIREEWDLPEEKLLDLKRLQRRMSIGSLAGMQQVTVKRQYLVRSVKEDLPCYIVHPHSYKRLVWDCLAIFAIIFETTISPLHLYRMNHSMQLTAETMQWVASAFWTLDIPASFFTAVYVNDVLRFRMRDIALNYLKSWCLYDVLMLAGDVVVLAMSETDVQAGVLRVARTRRLFRLLRVFQTIRLWKVLQGFPSLQNQLTALRARFGSLTQPVISLGLLMAFAVHVLGSLWFAAGDTEGGWVREENLDETSLAHQYIRSLEWSVSKLPPSALRSTVELNTAAERWLGIFGTCMALLTGSLFISVLTNTMAEVARERTRTTKILQAVRRYCHTYSISYAYTRQMKRYVEREHRRNEIQCHMSLLQTLPEGMVRELFQEARSRTLHAHAFFKEIGLSDPGMELNLCSQAVNELYYLAGDVIFDTTSKAEGMYQIAAGQGIYFFWSQSEPLGTRRRKDSSDFIRFQGVFGGASARSQTAFPMVQTSVEARGYVAEAALWVKAWRHQGQLQALIESRALLVSTDLLFKVLQGYANCMANTVVYARCFVQELNKTARLCKQVTDLPLAPLQHNEGEKKRSRSGSITSILFPPKIVQPESR